MKQSSVAKPVETDAVSTGAKSILVLEKAWTVLDAFTAAHHELTMKQIRGYCGFPASTTVRLVHNLLDQGLLERHGDLYRIGSRVLTWSESARRALDVIPLLMPVLEQLRDTTGESAALYECRRLQRVCVAVVPTRQAVIWQLHVGLTTPLHVGSGGRALLAFDRELYDMVRDRTLESFTGRTFSDWDRLDRALAETRRTGAAVSFEELANGVAGVSAPVIGMGGRVVGSLGVSGPAQRFQPDDMRRYVPAVVNAGRQASHVMGGEFPVPPTGASTG